MKVPGNVEKLTWSTGDTTLSCLLIFCLIDTPQTTNEREHETSFSNCWLPFTFQQQNGCSSEHHNMKTCRNKNMDTGRIQLCSNFKFELWLQFWFFPLPFLFSLPPDFAIKHSHKTSVLIYVTLLLVTVTYSSMSWLYIPGANQQVRLTDQAL